MAARVASDDSSTGSGECACVGTVQAGLFCSCIGLFEMVVIATAALLWIVVFHTW